MAELLVLAAGRRRYVVEALARSKSMDDVLLVADQDRQTPGLSVPGVTPLVEPLVPAEADRWLLELCQSRGISAVLSLHDYQALRLADLSDQLREAGCRWIGPTADWARTMLAKSDLAAYLVERDPGLAIPTFTSGEELSTTSSTCWVVKEDRGSGSSGLRMGLSDAEALAALGADPELVAQPHVAAEEWNLDFFVWPNGTVSGVSAKKKLRMRNGETDAAIVVREANVPFDYGRVVRALAGRHHLGNVDVDLFVGCGLLQVIDVNPRFGGGYAFSLHAGYEAAAAVWDLAHGRDEARPLTAVRDFTGAKSIEVVPL